MKSAWVLEVKVLTTFSVVFTPQKFDLVISLEKMPIRKMHKVKINTTKANTQSKRDTTWLITLLLFKSSLRKPWTLRIIFGMFIVSWPIRRRIKPQERTQATKNLPLRLVDYSSRFWLVFFRNTQDIPGRILVFMVFFAARFYLAKFPIKHVFVANHPGHENKQVIN